MHKEATQEKILYRKLCNYPRYDTQVRDDDTVCSKYWWQDAQLSQRDCATLRVTYKKNLVQWIIGHVAVYVDSLRTVILLSSTADGQIAGQLYEKWMVAVDYTFCGSSSSVSTTCRADVALGHRQYLDWLLCLVVRDCQMNADVSRVSSSSVSSCATSCHVVPLEHEHIMTGDIPDGWQQLPWT